MHSVYYCVCMRCYRRCRSHYEKNKDMILDIAYLYVKWMKCIIMEKLGDKIVCYIKHWQRETNYQWQRLGLSKTVNSSLFIEQIHHSVWRTAKKNLKAANSFSLIWTEVNACLFWARKFTPSDCLVHALSASGCLECRWSPGTLFKSQVEDVRTSISMDPDWFYRWNDMQTWPFIYLSRYKLLLTFWSHFTMLGLFITAVRLP